MQNLIIDPEFQKLIEPLMYEEYEGLEKNIIANGCLDSIKVWNDIILDGHNRYKICQKHNIPFETQQINFQSRHDAKIWIIKNQFDRRNLSAWQRGQMALELKAIISERAKENQRTSTGGSSPHLLENSPKGEEPINTREELAKIAGISDNTIARVEKIQSEGTPEQIERLQTREASINEVYNEIKEKPHIAYSSGNNEWYTPSEYIESARIIMGSIDLDPASSELANTIVKATSYFTRETNGLNKAWQGKIWLNPPYSTDLIPLFIEKLVSEYDNENIKEAIVLVNNATETKWFQSLASIASAICFTFGRIKYWCPEGTFGAPLQGQALIYIGNNPIGFGNEFAKHGWITYFLDKIFPENL